MTYLNSWNVTSISIDLIWLLQWRHNEHDGVSITSLTIVYRTIYSGTDQRKHQSSASLAFLRGIHRWPVNSPHKRPVTRKMFTFDDVIMVVWLLLRETHLPLRPLLFTTWVVSKEYILHFSVAIKRNEHWFVCNLFVWVFCLFNCFS